MFAFASKANVVLGLEQDDARHVDQQQSRKLSQVLHLSRLKAKGC